MSFSRGSRHRRHCLLVWRQDTCLKRSKLHQNSLHNKEKISNNSCSKLARGTKIGKEPLDHILHTWCMHNMAKGQRVAVKHDQNSASAVT